MITHLLSGRSRLMVHLTGWTLVFVSFYYLISEFRGPEEVWLRTGLNLGFMLVLLLPLVENTLKHGDLEVNPTGFLRITLHNAPSQLIFSVESFRFVHSERINFSNGGFVSKYTK